jgi:tRNA (cmo5U34)-methyltransferase
MPRSLHEKSTVEEIRARFDADVERFSKLETGQQAAMDAPVILDIVARSAAAHIQPNGKILDIGCGAGNFTLRVLNQISPLDCVLVDLSQPMLDRAMQRVSAATSGRVQTIQSDMRSLEFEPASFDLILAGQVLHHLREDAQW